MATEAKQIRRSKPQLVSRNLLRVMDHTTVCKVGPDQAPQLYILEGKLLLLECPSCNFQSERVLSKNDALVLGLIFHRIGCRASAPPTLGKLFNERACWKCQDCGGMATVDPITEIVLDQTY